MASQGKRQVDVGWLLLLTPILWGATFPAADLGIARIGVHPFMAWTRFIGFVTILAAVMLIARRDLTRTELRRVIAPGLLLGGFIFVAYILQTEGLARTTATNAGFITGLYVVFVPLFGLALFRHPVGWAVWVALALSVIGLVLLSVPNLEHIRLRDGDGLVFLSAIAWAAQVVALGRLVGRHPTMLLSLAQMGWAAALHIATTLLIGTGLRPGEAASEAWLLLIVTGVLGSGVAYTLQVIAQSEISPTRAVVILAGESVAAAAFSAVWLGERLEVHQWIGATVVLLAMAVSELRARRVDLRAEAVPPT
jgi:drug/metabolite transporter (DMT)-like permease